MTQDCSKQRECITRCLLVLLVLGLALTGCGIAGVTQTTLDHYVPLVPGSFILAIVAGATAVLLAVLNFVRLKGLREVQKQSVGKKREFANAINTFQTFNVIAFLFYVSCCVVQGLRSTSHEETTSTIKGPNIALLVLSVVTAITNITVYSSLESFWRKSGIRTSSTWSEEEEGCRSALMCKFFVGAAIIVCVVVSMICTNNLENIRFKAAYIVTLVFGCISVFLVFLDIGNIMKVNKANSDLEKQDAEKTECWLGELIRIALTVLSVLQSLNILWTLRKMDDFYKKPGIRKEKKPANSVSQSPAQKQPQASTSVPVSSNPKPPCSTASTKTVPVKAEAEKKNTLSVVSASELERQNRLINEQINLQRSLNQLRSDSSASAECTHLSIEDLERRNRLIQQQIQLERELQTFHRENQNLYEEGHMYPPPLLPYTEGTLDIAPPSYESLDPK